jgi:tRNA(Ile)-lysidine synthase
MDSSVLAAVALELKNELPPLHFAHVNYHLRKPDSDHEEKFLATWAKKEKIAFHVKRFFPKKKPANLQAWAREKRLNFFSETIGKLKKGEGIVWVAHHQQDQAETILQRILRGASMRGLGGMEVLDQIGRLKLFRPFLEVPHHAIAKYARVHRLKFHHDKSNDEPLYLRNRVRHQILPLFLKENPQSIEVLAALGQNARETTQTLDILAHEWLRRAIKIEEDRAQIPLNLLQPLPSGLIRSICEQFFLAHHFSPQGLSKILPRVIQYVRIPRGRTVIPLKGRYVWILNKDFLTIQKA